MKVNKTEWINLTPEGQFALASAKFSHYAGIRIRGKCRKWATRLAHAALTLHPELREEGSLERYFVAKLGRGRGYHGADLTAFVEQAYSTGLARIAIEAGMASRPWHGNNTAGCMHAPEVGSDPAIVSEPSPTLSTTSPHQQLPVRRHRTGDSRETHMIVNTSTHIRIIRALLRMDSKSFAARLGISAGTLTSWERSRTAPNAAKRQELYRLCQENGIGFLPNGYPMPLSDCFLLQGMKAERDANS